MKVLLTGGTGFVGSRLREYIRNEGHEVRLLVRSGSEDKVDSSDSYEIVIGDIFNTNACLRACDGCDAVIHLIGIIREYPSRGVTFDQYHRVATLHIVDAARRVGVGRYIHMSALGSREDARSTYHRTKFAAEQLVRQSPLRWTIFRPSWVFGPGDHAVREIIDLIRKPIVPLINGAEMLVQPIAIDDVCSSMARSLLMPETQGQTYELGGPERLALRAIIEKIAAQLGVGIRTISVPARLIRPVVAGLERFPSFPLTSDLLTMMCEDNVCELDRYVKTFRIEPKPFGQILPTVLGGPAAPKNAPVLL
jgi:NADH dehydrogenase